MGVALVLRRVDWIGVATTGWGWLNAWPGLFTLTVSALVCQLAGVVLVVQDLRHYTRNQRLLVKMQRNIQGAFTNVTRERDAYWAAERQEKETEARKQMKSWAAFTTPKGADGAVKMMIGAVEFAKYLEHMNRQLWRVENLVEGLSLYTMEFRDTRTWAAWAGPLLLVAGIAFGSGAALLAL